MDSLRHLAFRLVKRWRDLRAGLLFLPGAIIVALMVLAIALTRASGLDEILLQVAATRALESSPEAVRTILVVTTGAMMTAVATLFSIVLVVQTLASQQFSPRIQGSLVRDHTSQVTLGLTLGNVVYGLIVLLAVHDDPPSVPVAASVGAVLLFLLSLALLVNFIHHVSQIVQINYIVEQIADATEQAIDLVLPVVLDKDQEPDLAVPEPPPPDSAYIESDRTGYIQSVDVRWLEQLGHRHDVTLWLLLPLGEFATRSVALVAVSPGGRCGARLTREVLDGIQIGPVRDLRQDPAFGLRQLSDVALRAISPAVNDPTTAVACLRQMGRLLVRAVGRHSPRPERDGSAPPPRLHLPVLRFTSLLDQALVQLRQYSRRDFAVSLGLLVVLRDLARETGYPAYLDQIRRHADDVRASRDPEGLTAGDLGHLDRAWAEVRDAIERQRAKQAVRVEADGGGPVAGG